MDDSLIHSLLRPPTWRTTLLGCLMLLFVALRVWHRRDALFDNETVGLFITAIALIAGTDKLLGR